MKIYNNLKEAFEDNNSPIIKNSTLIIIFLIILWFVYINPQIKKQLTKTNSTIRELTNKNIELDNIKRKNIKGENKINNIKLEINKYVSKNLRKEILSLYTQAKINLNSYNLLNSTEYINNENIFKNTEVYEFSGKTEDIFSFLNKLNQSKNSFKPKEINITKKNDLESLLIIKLESFTVNK